MKNALTLCEKQLASQKAIVGDIHPRIASTLMTMGAISEPEEQHRYHQQVLSILENCNPRNDLVTLDCLAMLGAISLDEGNFQEDLAHWQHILDIRRRIHASDHPEIAWSLKWLGDIYSDCMHDYSEVLRYYTESLAIYRANYENQHKDVIELEQCIAKVYEENGDFLRALECYYRLLKLQEQCLPAGDFQLSTLIDTIAKTHQKKGEKKEAMIFLQQKMSSQKMALGKYHPSVALTLMTIGNTSSSAKERHRYYEQALSILNKSSPRDEMRTIACMEMLGRLLLDERKFEKGVAYLLQVLDIQRRIQLLGSSDIAFSLELIGDAYSELKCNYSEALRYYSESLAIYRAKYLPQHDSVIEVEDKIQKARQKLKK